LLVYPPKACICIAPRVKDLRARQDNLLQRKVEIDALMSEKKFEPVSIETIRKEIEDMHTLLSEGTPTEHRAFIRDLVKEVTVTGDEVLISCFPYFHEEHLMAGTGVISTLRNGGRYWTRTSDLCDVNAML
jgi:site-specific DNA recombinase